MKLIKGLNSPTLQQYLAAGSTALLLNIDSTTVSLTFDPNTLEQRSLYQRAHTDNKQREQGIEPLTVFVWQNIGKALRFSWRCLMAGLQNMASTYSTPLSAMSTVVTEVNRASGSKA
uniref:Uncharacterized protein n=1 Tax=Lates calcarifer TaxID=8187 RepID=A0A4W6CP63_LATCA